MQAQLKYSDRRLGQALAAKRKMAHINLGVPHVPHVPDGWAVTLGLSRRHFVGVGSKV
jgi:hypothetical protein